MTPFQLGMLRNYGITYDWSFARRQQEATFWQRREIDAIVCKCRQAADRITTELLRPLEKP